MNTSATKVLRNSKIYQDLNPSKGEIRLVHIFPAVNAFDPIKCSLTTVSLHDKLDYEALSYTWGDPSITNPIMLCTTPFDVTENLYDALTSLRLSSDTRVLWIDAICINQTDIEERGHQVNQMRDVYKNAARVTVWLGVQTDTSNVGLEAFETLGSNDQIHLLDSPPCLGTEFAGKDYIGAMLNFFCMSWWERVWTVQETILAKKLLFRCGEKEVDGELVFKAQKNYHKHQSTCCSSMLTTLPRPPIHQLTVPLASIEVLDMYRVQIFNVEIEIGGSYENFLFPDYNKDVQQVYEATALEIVKRHPRNELFSFLEGRTTNSTKFPSWVPEWRTLQDPLAFRVLHIRTSWLRQYNASTKPTELVSLNPGKALISGVTIDKIKTVSASIPTTEPLKPHRTIYAEWASLCGATDNPDDIYVDGTTSLHDAFWITLVNGMLLTSVTNPDRPTFGHVDVETHREWYEVWWEWMSSPEGTIPSDIRLFHFSTFVLGSTIGRKFFMTEKGYIGTGPVATGIGDVVVVSEGGLLPCILRGSGGTSEVEGADVEEFEVLGDAYIRGLVDGEADKAAEAGILIRKKYVLV